MSNKEISYLVKNELRYLQFLNPNYKFHYKNIYNKYKNIIDKEISSLNIFKESEKLYCYINNINKKLLCKHCQKEFVEFKNYSLGYREYCSTKCVSKYFATNSNIQQKNLIKFTLFPGIF